MSAAAILDAEAPPAPSLVESHRAVAAELETVRALMEAFDSLGVSRGGAVCSCVARGMSTVFAGEERHAAAARAGRKRLTLIPITRAPPFADSIAGGVTLRSRSQRVCRAATTRR